MGSGQWLNDKGTTKVILVVPFFCFLPTAFCSCFLFLPAVLP